MYQTKYTYQPKEYKPEVWLLKLNVNDDLLSISVALISPMIVLIGSFSVRLKW